MEGLIANRVIALILCTLALLPARVIAEHIPGVPAYSFGAVPQFEQRKLYRIWRPIIDELERRTGLAFHLKGSAKIPEFENKFMAGAFDFAYMNPYHVLLAHDSQRYRPLVRDGSRKLQGILVVHRDSPVTDIRELEGKEADFPAPNALGASLLMRAELARLHGINVIPRYVQTHSSVYLHVATGMAAAGGGVASTLAAQQPEVRDKLRIIYRTRTMSPHPVAAHPRVPEAHRKLVRQALLDMAQTAEGAALLAKIPMRQPRAATLSDYVELGLWGLDAFYVTQ
jgi:phosphonate transport system substrate-binding protein